VPAERPSPGRSTQAPPWLAIVLAGGTSRRWGGRDKTAVALAGRPVLLHVVGALLPEAAALAVVAPADHPARSQVEGIARRADRPLIWTREEPPGGGPVPALAAGLAGLTSGVVPAGTGGGAGRTDGSAGRTEGSAAIVVLAGDLPFARPSVPRLLAALEGSGADGAIGLDPDGRRQPLLAAYRTAALRPRLLGPDAPALADLPLRAVLDGLILVEVPVSETEASDLDTPGALTAARTLLAAHAASTLDQTRAPNRYFLLE
jgi:molybdopterin-guanine dinucleotide biosynthesis protein A